MSVYQTAAYSTTDKLRWARNMGYIGEEAIVIVLVPTITTGEWHLCVVIGSSTTPEPLMVLKPKWHSALWCSSEHTYGRTHTHAVLFAGRATAEAQRSVLEHVTHQDVAEALRRELRYQHDRTRTDLDAAHVRIRRIHEKRTLIKAAGRRLGLKYLD